MMRRLTVAAAAARATGPSASPPFSSSSSPLLISLPSTTSATITSKHPNVSSPFFHARRAYSSVSGPLAPTVPLRGLFSSSSSSSSSSSVMTSPEGLRRTINSRGLFVEHDDQNDPYKIHSGEFSEEELARARWHHRMGVKYGASNHELFRQIYLMLCGEMKAEYETKPPAPFPSELAAAAATRRSANDGTLVNPSVSTTAATEARASHNNGDDSNSNGAGKSNTTPTTTRHKGREVSDAAGGGPLDLGNAETSDNEDHHHTSADGGEGERSTTTTTTRSKISLDNLYGGGAAAAAGGDAVEEAEANGTLHRVSVAEIERFLTMPSGVFPAGEKDAHYGSWRVRLDGTNGTVVFTRDAVAREDARGGESLGRVTAFADTSCLSDPPRLNAMLTFADWYPFEVLIERNGVVLHYSIAANEGGMHMRNLRVYDMGAVPYFLADLQRRAWSSCQSESGAATAGGGTTTTCSTVGASSSSSSSSFAASEANATEANAQAQQQLKNTSDNTTNSHVNNQSNNESNPPPVAPMTFLMSPRPEASHARFTQFYDGPCLWHLELDVQNELHDVMQDHGVSLDWARWAASWVFYLEHRGFTGWALGMLEELIPADPSPAACAAAAVVMGVEQGEAAAGAAESSSSSSSSVSSLNGGGGASSSSSLSSSAAAGATSGNAGLQQTNHNNNNSSSSGAGDEGRDPATASATTAADALFCPRGGEDDFLLPEEKAALDEPEEQVAEVR